MMLNSELEDEIKIQRQPEYQFLAFQVCCLSGDYDGFIWACKLTEVYSVVVIPLMKL